MRLSAFRRLGFAAWLVAIALIANAAAQNQLGLNVLEATTERAAVPAAAVPADPHAHHPTPEQHAAMMAAAPVAAPSTPSTRQTRRKLSPLRARLALPELPGEAAESFETVGGFVLDRLGRIPRTGETFEWGGWRCEVVDMDRHRVDKVLVSRAVPVPPAATPARPA